MAGKSLGAGSIAAACDIFTRVISVQLLSAVLVAALGLLGVEWLLPLLGTNALVGDLAGEYLRIILLLMPIGMVAVALVYFVQADGRPMLANIALILGAVSNVCLDWLFIAKLDLGISGAALATGSSYTLTLLVLIPHFFSNKTKLSFRFGNGNWRDVGRAAFNGVSEFVNEASVGITALMFNWVMMLRFGVDGVAAYAVINYLFYMGMMANFALGDALQPLVSYCFGARKPKRIRAFVEVALVSAVLIGVVLVSCLLLIPQLIIAIFIDASEVTVIAIAEQFIQWFWPTFIFMGANVCFSAYCTAMHKPMVSTGIALLRSLILPALGLLLLPVLMNDKGVYMALSLAEGITFCVVLLLVGRYLPERLLVKPGK